MNDFRWWSIRGVTFAGLMWSLLVTACAVNPATGKRELSLVSESQEIAMGQQGAEETLRSIPLVPDSAVQRYVRSVAMRLVGVAERPNLPWTFHVLDDAAVNAFAYPGGFIFLTRGILTHMNSEAELAGVLGHEIGHVTARHTASQISKAQLFTAGLVVGSVVSSTVAQFAGTAGTGLGLLFMKFGRDAEYQADELGFRYMTRDSYDPRAMSSMFTMLQRQSAMSGHGRLPEWQSTHPDPENRVARNDQRVSSFPGDPDTLRISRDGFLRVTDGLIFGEDPRQGFFDGPTFNHPDLRFTIRFPEGWATRNQPDAVVASSPEGDAMSALTFAAEASARTALTAFLGQSGIQSVRQNTSSVNGLTGAAAEFVAVLDQKRLQGMVQFVEYDGRVYRLLGYTGANTFGRYRSAFSQYTTSFSRLTDRAALDRQPVHVRLVTLPRSMTLEAFNQAYPSTIEIDRLAVINGVQLGETMPRGRLVKQVR